MNLANKTSFNYHAVEGTDTLARALKIGLLYSLLPDAKAKDVFVKRLNKYGYHKDNPIEITDLPTTFATPEETIEHFSAQHGATVRIYAGASLELREHECADATAFIYIHEPLPGLCNVVLKPHCLHKTGSGRKYKHHCHWCNTSYQRDHIKCERGHNDLSRCATCHMQYLPSETHVCWRRKCWRCRIDVDIREHVCCYVAPVARENEIRMVSFDVGKNVVDGRVVAIGVDVIDGDSHHAFTIAEFLHLVQGYMQSKETVVFVCASTDDLSLVFAEARQTQGMFLNPSFNGNKVVMLKSNGCHPLTYNTRVLSGRYVKPLVKTTWPEPAALLHIIHTLK
jgi:hypothetical protein